MKIRTYVVWCVFFSVLFTWSNASFAQNEGRGPRSPEEQIELLERLFGPFGPRFEPDNSLNERFDDDPRSFDIDLLLIHATGFFEIRLMYSTDRISSHIEQPARRYAYLSNGVYISNPFMASIFIRKTKNWHTYPGEILTNAYGCRSIEPQQSVPGNVYHYKGYNCSAFR